MSEEEKKERLRAHMLETGRIYSNATIEQASKATGISAMVIKNILQALADEGTIDHEKIGAGTFFWCFKSKESIRVLEERDQIKQRLAEVSSESRKLEERL